MKKFFLILATFFLLIFFNSCLTTLHPFFTGRDVVFNPTLIGEWRYVSKSEKGSVFFEAIPQVRLPELAPGIRNMADKGYLVTWKDSTGQPTSKYFVFLAMIGNSFYLDHYPAEMAFEKPVAKIFKEHYLKMHSCYKLNMHGKNILEMKLLEGSFLDDLIAKKQIRIHYEELGQQANRKIITASTEELQQYLLKYGDNPKAYSVEYSYTLTRIINY